METAVRYEVAASPITLAQDAHQRYLEKFGRSILIDQAVRLTAAYLADDAFDIPVARVHEAINSSEKAEIAAKAVSMQAEEEEDRRHAREKADLIVTIRTHLMDALL